MALPQSQRDAFRVALDPLSAITDELRIRELFIGGPFHLSPPWAMVYRAAAPQLYLITDGPVCLRVRPGSPDQMAVTLDQGDFVFLPGGVPHLLSDSFQTEPQEGRFTGQMAPDGTPGTTGFLGMECELHGKPQIARLSTLPDVICIRGSEWTQGAALAATLAAFGTERSQRGPGHATVLKRLVEIALTQVVRTWIDLPGHTTGWLRGLKDPNLGPVLHAVNERPREKWSLLRLADLAGMSRSLFAEHFRTIVGQTPMAYVTQVRMDLAARMLSNEGGSLKAIASAAGYESSASFRHHFKRQFGVLPREFRGQHSEQGTRGAKSREGNGPAGGSSPPAGTDSGNA